MMITVSVSRSMWSSTTSTSSSTTNNAHHLRSLLDQLHSEADVTRRKANNARFRLLRLSEAAENLCRQAAVSVRKGKEDDARELLLQKKKIKLALEKSKGRVELLDELAAKLNEAISVKEAQLVKHVASDLEVNGDDVGGPVRIVSPIQDNSNTIYDGHDIIFNQSDVVEDHELVPDTDSEGKILSDNEPEEAFFESISSRIEATTFSSFRGPSSIAALLEDLDQQLSKIENDLMTILELPTMALEIVEKTNDSRLQQLEILENIRGARVSIRKYVQEITGTG